MAAVAAIVVQAVVDIMSFVSVMVQMRHLLRGLLWVVSPQESEQA